MGDKTALTKETVDALIEGCRNVYWLISEIQMFRNRPEFTRALEQIDKALKDATGQSETELMIAALGDDGDWD